MASLDTALSPSLGRPIAARCATALAGALSLGVLMAAAGWVTWQVLPAPADLAASLARPAGEICAADCGGTGLGADGS